MGVDRAPGTAKRRTSPIPSPTPRPPCNEPNENVVAQFVDRGFRVSQVREALTLTEGDETLAEEVLNNWKRIPPPSFETTCEGDATGEVLEEIDRDRYEKQRTSSWSGSWQTATPRVLLESPVMGAAEAADILDTVAIAATASAEKAADMRDKATDVAEKAATWMMDAFSTVSRTLTEKSEMPPDGHFSHRALSHRDSYEEFYGYDGDSGCGGPDSGHDGPDRVPTTPVSRKPSSPHSATTMFFLPDQDMSLKDIDIEEALGEEINLEDDVGTARTWEVLKSMSTLFPSMSPSMGSESEKQEKEVKKQRRADSTRCGEISALLANGWMDPDSVRRLKDELKELQAKAKQEAQPRVDHVQTWHGADVRTSVGGAEPVQGDPKSFIRSRTYNFDFPRGPTPVPTQQPQTPPAPVTTKDSGVILEECASDAEPVQVAVPAKAKPAGNGAAPGPKGKGKGGQVASTQETVELAPPPPAHSGKGGGKGPGKGAAAPAKAQKGSPPAKGSGKGAPGGPPRKAAGKAPLAKATAAVPKGKPIGRRFDWKMLPSDKVEGTVFANLSAKVSVDVACLRALFEKPKEVEEEGKTTRKSMPGIKIAETEVQLLARGRAQNIMIALRKQPLTDAVLDGLDMLDFEAPALTPEAIEVLTGAVPTPEEAKLLVGHRMGNGKLREVERKIMPLAHLERPAAGQRLRLMLFHKTMGGLSEDVHLGLSSLKAAFDDAQNSPAFRTVLCHTVRLGSVINFGNSQVEVDDKINAEKAAAAVGGFGLDALSRLALFRAPGNSRITLLHVLVAQVSVADPDLPKRLTEEMGNVHKAAKRSISSLSDDVSAFIREAEHVSSCVAANGGSNSSDDPITVKLAKFSEHASSEAGSLAKDLSETREAARATLSFFAIKSTDKDVDTKSLELCNLLSEFLSVFEKTKKDIVKNPNLAAVCHSGAPKTSKVPSMSFSRKPSWKTPKAAAVANEAFFPPCDSVPKTEPPKMPEHAMETQDPVAATIQNHEVQLLTA